jgi:hypothetical protein
MSYNQCRVATYIDISMRLESKLCNSILKVKILSVLAKHTKQEWVWSAPSECPHKVSDLHLHHEWQWIAAITPYWLHHHPTMGIDKYIFNLLKIPQRESNKNLHPEFLSHLHQQWEASICCTFCTGRKCCHLICRKGCWKHTHTLSRRGKSRVLNSS